MVIDEEQSDDLGLPLARGPFATIDAAREAIEAARSGPAPRSELAAKVAAHARTRPSRTETEKAARPHHAAAKGSARAPKAPPPPPVVIRPYRPADGDALRALWEGAGFRSLGDDDASLAVFARRNPGLLLVAVEGDRIVGSALGGWDGRRGWIYHVATAESHRRRGIGRDLVRRAEAELAELGAPKVNLVVRDGDDDAAGFWKALGYEPARARQYGRELAADAAEAAGKGT